MKHTHSHTQTRRRMHTQECAVQGNIRKVQREPIGWQTIYNRPPFDTVWGC